MSKEYVMQLEATNQNLRRDNTILKEITNEQEKILNVLFEKRVNIYQLIFMEGLNEYNSTKGKEDQLTEEEYNSLKKYYNDRFYRKSEEDKLTKKEYDLLKGC